jgi:hypothetical protein
MELHGQIAPFVSVCRLAGELIQGTRRVPTSLRFLVSQLVRCLIHSDNTGVIRVTSVEQNARQLLTSENSRKESVNELFFSESMAG